MFVERSKVPFAPNATGEPYPELVAVCDICGKPATCVNSQGHACTSDHLRVTQECADRIESIIAELRAGRVG